MVGSGDMQIANILEDMRCECGLQFTAYIPGRV